MKLIPDWLKTRICSLSYGLWLFDSKPSIRGLIEEKFGKMPCSGGNAGVRQGTIRRDDRALTPSYRVDPAPIKKGIYRNINGNQVHHGASLAAERLV
jgi:hypothetical protein